MKKTLFSFWLLLALFFFFSCKSDDGVSDFVVNTPPSQVSNIKAEVIPKTALVQISWDAATDENGDEVRYDIIINKELAKTNLTATMSEVDITQFLSTKKQSRLAKGIEVTLELEIKAYDPSSSFSNTSITKTLQINRLPADFAFENIVFNTDSYNELNILWKPSSDPDGDTLMYSVYMNDITLVENYQIPEGEQFGSLDYTEDFLSLSNAPITIKIVVTDSSGETKEISESFDFKATDVVLGELNTPYNEELQFVVTETELDSVVGYHFMVIETTNFALSNSVNAIMQIKDDSNNIIFSDTSLEGVLEPGNYSLIIFGSRGVNTSGSIAFDLRSSSATDVNLGVVTVPSDNRYDLNFEGEEDNTINYYFEVTELTGYEFQTTMITNLYDQNDNLIQTTVESNTDIFFGEELALGNYRLEIIKPDYFGNTSQFRLQFSNVFLTDQNLGILENNAYHTISHVVERDELDAEVVFSFETDEITSFWMRRTDNFRYSFSLFDGNGILIGNSAQDIFAIDLPIGQYLIKLNFDRYTAGAISNFSAVFLLQESTYTDEDWGVISVPFSGGYRNSAEPKFDPDLKVVYTFETTEITPNWNYRTSDNSGDRVSFTDEAGNEVPRNGSSQSGEVKTGVNLPPGKYRIEVTDGRGAGSRYGISFGFSLYNLGG